MPSTVLVSACLLGLQTRYDGSDNGSAAVLAYLQRQALIAIPVCPEQLAGLPTPRPKVWFSQGDGVSILAGRGKMIDENGRDMGAIFRRGAEMCLRIARLNRCKMAILKQRSPSCGCGAVYRCGETVSGLGVTAALLKENNIRLLSEEEFRTE